MKTKISLFSNWHTMRWVALVIALFFATLAITDQDIFTGMLSAFFLFQAVTNKGCLVSTYCGMPVQTSAEYETQDTEPDFTEVK